VDILRQMHREIFSSELKIPEALRVEIADYLGEIQFRLVEGADEEIQLSTLLAKLVLLGKAAKAVKPSK
jgi:replication factor C small subunit